MTERKFTDEEVIKALECCITNKCDECDIYKECHNENGKGRVQVVLDLINRKNAEIERLQSMNQAKLDMIHDIRAELETAKTEAIKEFDKKFKRASDLICIGSLGSGAADIKNYYRISFDSYEKLIQEMTEKAAHDE